MVFPRFTHPITGVVVPVSALRSKECAGIGEFPDLVLLARWAVDIGIKLIQILPVNDTGYERSPYSALSAFALHPIYARLNLFPEATEGPETISAEIDQLRKAHRHQTIIDFDAVLSSKMMILRKMWETSSSLSRKEAARWADDNPWVMSYALFSLLKEENGLNSWIDWEKYRNPDSKDPKKLWKKRKHDAEFWVWLQWRLEKQFREVSRQLEELGVALKGDIPILITDDSADLWAERRNFNLKMRAGAPPDAGSPGGQNWGFPTYNWIYLEGTDYRWWRERIDQAAKFYHAYRIDHVLGFFRIWAVPENDIAALGGRYEPPVPINAADLNALGFDEGRITWLSMSHFPKEELREVFGEEWESVVGLLHQVGSEDLWRETRHGPTERDVEASALSDGGKETLKQLLRNRTLIDIGENAYVPAWNYQASRGWNSLSDDERAALDELIRRRDRKSEALWEETGRRLLKMMKSDGSMLVCAEDLGSVPDFVPGVLNDLGILGLKVVRWARMWDRPGEPYIPFSEYPELSVATGSVHDSTTIRGWLAAEAQNDVELRRVMAVAPATKLSGVSGCRQVLEKIQDSNSLITAHPLQDLLALDPSCTSENPAEERINVPGTVEPTNWCWRMIPELEHLKDNSDLNYMMRALCAGREVRSADFPGGRK